MQVNDNEAQSNMDCTITTDSVCYIIGKRVSTNVPGVAKITFTNLATHSIVFYSSGVHLSSVNAISTQELIVAGFDISSTPHAHMFYRLNISAEAQIWGTTTPALGK